MALSSFFGWIIPGGRFGWIIPGGGRAAAPKSDCVPGGGRAAAPKSDCVGLKIICVPEKVEANTGLVLRNKGLREREPGAAAAATTSNYGCKTNELQCDQAKGVNCELEEEITLLKDEPSMDEYLQASISHFLGLPCTKEQLRLKLEVAEQGQHALQSQVFHLQSCLLKAKEEVHLISEALNRQVAQTQKLTECCKSVTEEYNRLENECILFKNDIEIFREAADEAEERAIEAENRAAEAERKLDQLNAIQMKHEVTKKACKDEFGVHSMISAVVT